MRSKYPLNATFSTNLGANRPPSCPVQLSIEAFSGHWREWNFGGWHLEYGWNRFFELVYDEMIWSSRKGITIVLDLLKMKSRAHHWGHTGWMKWHRTLHITRRSASHGQMLRRYTKLSDRAQMDMSPSGYTIDETSLPWLDYFDEQTKKQTIGRDEFFLRDNVALPSMLTTAYFWPTTWGKSILYITSTTTSVKVCLIKNDVFSCLQCRKCLAFEPDETWSRPCKPSVSMDLLVL